MSKAKNYYLFVAAKVVDDDYEGTISGCIKLTPGSSMDTIVSYMKKRITQENDAEPKEIIVTSLSEISKGLYERLTENEK